jgi:hypothetical protein
VSSASGAPGTSIVGTITGVPVGTVATVTFDGEKVGQATATADGQGRAAPGAVRPIGHLSVTAEASGGAIIRFMVPSDAAPGPHTVVMSGAGVSCSPVGDAGFAVLGTSVVRGGSGPLSRTGTDLALYLAVALVLLVAGWQLVRSARRRRRRVTRQRPVAGSDRSPGH